jgi:hypothetical protein
VITPPRGKDTSFGKVYFTGTVFHRDGLPLIES